MKENKYDDPTFFGKYSQMPRSKEGLAAAGEWHVLRRMLPPFEGKRVLDLGCGFGWHVHDGDSETYYILRGEGEYNDNGTLLTVGAGDVTFVASGEGHSLRNTGEGDLEFIALILYK